jgi:phosphoribosylformylglycinamidine cyclo-ligase
MKKFTYKQAGVNINKAESFAKKIKLANASKIEAFGSAFSLQPYLKQCKNPYLVASTDGVGTKLKIAQSLNIHNTVGIDLVAMNVNDIICTGAKPLFFLDYIACGKVSLKVLNSVVSGINKGLKESNCLLLGGETAEMPGMYKKDEYDLAGFCLALADKKKMITGKNIKKGDVLIGLASSGLHSNGFSLVRKVLGPRGIKKYGRQLLIPTRIYVKPILSLKSPVKAIAHITGGAFYNKATKILPKGLGMVIDKKSWKVPKIFKVIQDKGRISDKEMYTVFNMGIGMILVVDKNQAKKIKLSLNKTSKAYIIGEVVKSRRRIEFR